MGLWDGIVGWFRAGAESPPAPRAPTALAVMDQRQLFGSGDQPRRRVRKAQSIDELEQATQAAMAGSSIPARVQEPLDAFECNVWAHACASRNAEAVAAVRLRHIDKRTGQELDEVPPLLANPNPAMTFFEHLELLLIDMEMVGTAYEYADPKDGGLWRLNPARTTPVPDPRRRIGAYDYDIGRGRKIRIPAEQVIQRRMPNPASDLYGLGAGGVALELYKLDEQMTQYERAFMKNGARLSYIIETELELTKTQRKRLLIEWIKAHAGAAKNGSTAVMSHGLKAREAGESHKDMEFVEGRKVVRDSIIAGHGTPPCLVGVFDNANYSNTDNQLKIFYDFKVRNTCRRITPGWNRFPAIFPRLGASYVEFDEKEINDRTLDPEKMALAAKALYESGLYGRNAVRKKFFRDGPVDDDELDDIKPTPAPMFPGFAGSLADKELPADQQVAVALQRADAVLRKWLGSSTAAGATVETSLERQLPEAARHLPEVKRAALAQLLARSSSQRVRDRKSWTASLAQILARREKRLRDDVIRPLFRRQRDDLLKKLDAAERHFSRKFPVVSAQAFGTLPKSLSDELLFDVEDYLQGFSDEMRPAIRDLLEETGRAATASLGLDDATFDVADPNAVKYAREQALRFAKFTLETTREELRTELADAIEAGETLSDIRKRIEDQYAEIDSTRAETIARTEALGAGQYGALEGFRQSEVVDKKSWITTSESPRPSHQAAAAASPIPLGDAFPNGLQFPGDSSTNDAGEIVNCACGLQPGLIGEEAA